MEVKLVEQFNIVISEYRLRIYQLTPTDTHIDRCVNYLWNMALSKELYPLLHGVEIALRNKLNAVLNRYSGLHGTTLLGLRRKKLNGL